MTRPPSSRHRSFRVHGLDCADEVAVLKRALGPLVGGEDHVSFDLLQGEMRLDDVTVSDDEVVRVVARTGMRAEVQGDPASDHEPTTWWEGYRRTVTTVASGVFTLAGFITHVVLVGEVTAALGGGGVDDGVPPVARALYGLGLVSGVWLVLPRAWYAVRTLRPDMNLLMTVAVVGAVAIDEWFEAATVACLFAVSLALESWSIGQARRAVAALLELEPTTVRLVEPDGHREIPAAEAPVGSRFLVKPGERVALDGEVRTGASRVDESPVTGESLPVTKTPGTTVFAGSINGEGGLEVISTKRATDTVLSSIVRLVRQAQSRRSPSEQWVSTFARVYTPTVFALAFLVWLGPPLLLGEEWDDWGYRALVLLVIGCPCALVISTPVSIVASLAAAARQGVLIKGGIFAELPAQLEAVAFDKTGTLTSGRPVVADVVANDGHTPDEMLSTAAALEAHSTHPLARAIVAHARARAIRPAHVRDFQLLPGKGGIGWLDGRRYWIGSLRYLEERGQATAMVRETLQTLSGAGRTVVAIGADDHVCGFIALSDPVRPVARSVVGRLRREGLQRIVMLTGDNTATAQAIGRETGVDEIRAELLPADKVAAVESLLARHRVVAMVGDGVNDAPAMARATLGIAMGAAGSDAAIETADIALMADDLAKLPWLIQHSRRTLRVIRVNIAFALGVKAAFVAFTLAGFASLWAAITADMGASLLVVFNGLRLLRAGRTGV